MGKQLHWRILLEKSSELLGEVWILTHVLPARYKQTIGWDLLMMLWFLSYCNDIFWCLRFFYNRVKRAHIISFWCESWCQAQILAFTEVEVVVIKETRKGSFRFQNTKVILRVIVSRRQQVVTTEPRRITKLYCGLDQRSAIRVKFKWRFLLLLCRLLLLVFVLMVMTGGQVGIVSEDQFSSQFSFDSPTVIVSCSFEYLACLSNLSALRQQFQCSRLQLCNFKGGLSPLDS